MSQFSVIIAAAGSGTRFDSGNQKKTYAILNGKPMWQHSVQRFASRDDIAQILIVVSPEDEQWFADMHSNFLTDGRIDVVPGGNERFISVGNALAKVNADVEFVAIHDGARPCVSQALLERVFSTACVHGNAVPAVPVSSTLKRSASGTQIDQTVDRSELYLSQTPQVFKVQVLKDAYAQLGDRKPTDEAQLIESTGQTVFLAEGCVLNRKVTSQQDIQFAEAALATLDQTDSHPIHFDGPISDSRLR